MVHASTLTRATVTIGRAAFAAGFSGARTLRIALGAGVSLPLLGQIDRPAPFWRRFAVVDVFRVALLRRLMAHGLTSAGAGWVIRQAVDRHLGGLTDCGVELPAGFLANRLEGMALHVARTPKGCAAEVVPCGTAPRHETAITIDLAAVARDAIGRLATYRNPAK